MTEDQDGMPICVCTVAERCECFDGEPLMIITLSDESP